jgi:hypothetical protein
MISDSIQESLDELDAKMAAPLYETPEYMAFKAIKKGDPFEEVRAKVRAWKDVLLCRGLVDESKAVHIPYILLYDDEQDSPAPPSSKAPDVPPRDTTICLKTGEPHDYLVRALDGKRSCIRCGQIAPAPAGRGVNSARDVNPTGDPNHWSEVHRRWLDAHGGPAPIPEWTPDQIDPVKDKIDAWDRKHRIAGMRGKRTPETVARLKSRLQARQKAWERFLAQNPDVVAWFERKEREHREFREKSSRSPSQATSKT